MSHQKSKHEHIREIITAKGDDAVTISPSPVLRWQRRSPDPGEAGMFLDGKRLVLQQAWIDNSGGVHWRDVPIADGA
jgi:hypothetical protein